MKLILPLLTAIALLSAIQAADQTAKPETSATAPKKYKNVDPETFDKMRKEDQSAVLLDVRTKEEYKRGHIPGSILIDFNSPDFEKEVARLDKNKTYLVHCAVGGRSARACKKMEGLSFLKLYNLEGGMGAWEKAGKPVEK